MLRKAHVQKLEAGKLTLSLVLEPTANAVVQSNDITTGAVAPADVIMYTEDIAANDGAPWLAVMHADDVLAAVDDLSLPTRVMHTKKFTAAADPPLPKNQKGPSIHRWPTLDCTTHHARCRRSEPAVTIVRCGLSPAEPLPVNTDMTYTEWMALEANVWKTCLRRNAVIGCFSCGIVGILSASCCGLTL